LLPALASTGAVAIGFASVFLNSSLLGVVTGVLLGTILASVVQRRTQKQFWKRELSRTNADLIYVPLFREIKSIASTAKRISIVNEFPYLYYPHWEAIAADYLYDFISVDLRSMLERFYSAVSTYDKLSLQIKGLLNELILSQASTFFKVKVTQIEYYLDYNKVPSMTASERIPLENLAIYGKYPRDALSAAYPDRQSPRFRVAYFSQTDGKQSIVNLDTTEKIRPVDDFWKEVLEYVPKEQISRMQKALSDLILDSGALQDSILRLIREPWSV
jgi:hypothetical protein